MGPDDEHERDNEKDRRDERLGDHVQVGERAQRQNDQVREKHAVLVVLYPQRAQCRVTAVASLKEARVRQERNVGPLVVPDGVHGVAVDEKEIDNDGNQQQDGSEKRQVRSTSAAPPGGDRRSG
jgi:hypothetical protein